MSRRLLALLIPLTLCLATARAEIADSWEAAQARSAETGRLLVVDFWTDWCTPCKRFNADSENDETLRARLEEVILFKTDAEREGKALADRYSVGLYPAYMVQSPEGEVLGRWSGYESAEEWVERIDEIRADPTTMDEKRARFERSPSAGDALTLAQYHESRQEFDEAVEFFEHARRLDPEQTSTYDDALFYCVYYAFRKEKASLEALAARADVILARGEEASDEDLYYVARYMAASARRADRLEDAARFISAAVERLRSADENDEAAQSSLSRLAIDHALAVEKDEEKAIALKKASYGEGWLSDPDAMNGFAWWCFENSLNLEEAETIARDAVALATTVSEKIQILDTAAEICNARGECRDAVSLMQEAVDLDPTNARSKEQLERFKKLAETTG